jgi:hypothetical protein
MPQGLKPCRFFCSCTGDESPAYRPVHASPQGLKRLRKKAGILANRPKSIPQGLKPN